MGGLLTIFIVFFSKKWQKNQRVRSRGFESNWGKKMLVDSPTTLILDLSVSLLGKFVNRAISYFFKKCINVRQNIFFGFFKLLFDGLPTWKLKFWWSMEHKLETKMTESVTADSESMQNMSFLSSLCSSWIWQFFTFLDPLFHIKVCL